MYIMECRKHGGRRSGKERRKYSDAHYSGPEKRSGLERRSGLDRRKGVYQKNIRGGS
jgi:hypothetical protein